MRRLIDADDFKKFLQALCKAGAPYSGVVELIDKQPTAYDVDKVVKRLDEQQMVVDQWNNAYINKTDAIDIVKKGGVE